MDILGVGTDAWEKLINALNTAPWAAAVFSKNGVYPGIIFKFLLAPTKPYISKNKLFHLIHGKAEVFFAVLDMNLSALFGLNSCSF